MTGQSKLSRETKFLFPVQPTTRRIIDWQPLPVDAQAATTVLILNSTRYSIGVMAILSYQIPVYTYPVAPVAQRYLVTL